MRSPFLGSLLTSASPKPFFLQSPSGFPLEMAPSFPPPEARLVLVTGLPLPLPAATPLCVSTRVSVTSLPPALTFPLACSSCAGPRFGCCHQQELFLLPAAGLCNPSLWLCVCVLSTFSCVRLCDPMVIHGIILAKILEWVGMTSRGSSGPRDQTQVSCRSLRQVDS